jgi:transcriptional regulator with XRE-family HTH domain
LFIFELGKLRLDRKLSQAELAAKVGTRQANISRLERGQGNPRLKTLLKIAQALDARLVIE